MSNPTTTTTTLAINSLVTTTTTSTATAIPPLSIVETVFIKRVGNVFVQTEASSGSDNTQTKKNAFASAFTFGTIASGENQKPIIVALRVPSTLLIKNIRIGLVDTGGIPFRDDIFGVYTSEQNELSDLIVPTAFFQGLATNADNYTISVSNADDKTSNYVYLSLNMPSGYYVNCGVVRFKWFFDFAN